MPNRQDRQFDEYIHEEDAPRPWRPPLTWTALILGGWLIYELTAQPALGAFFVCTKFGWNDLRTALWLRRIDPNRRRARACFWLHLASATGRVTLTGLMLMFAVFPAIGMLTYLLKGPQWAPNADPPMMAFFMGALAAVGVGFALFSLTFVVALVTAWRSGTKLWLNPKIHEARRESVWPARYQPLVSGENYFATVLSLHLFATIGLGSCCGVVPALAAVLDALGVADGAASVAIAIAIVFFLFAVPITALTLQGKIQERLIAGSPIECWGMKDWLTIDWQNMGLDEEGMPID